jgi:hypothetical protein
MRTRDEWKQCVGELGLPADVDWELIQARYRQLVLAFHPDVNPAPAAAERFRRIAAAYERLNTLQHQRRMRSWQELARLCEDPKIRQLPVSELGMRLRYSASANVRAAAACVLGTMGSREARRFLVSARQDADLTVRRLVVEALGKTGSLGELLRVLRSVDRELSHAYLHSLALVILRGWRRAVCWIRGLWAGGPSEGYGVGEAGK